MKLISIIYYVNFMTRRDNDNYLIYLPPRTAVKVNTFIRHVRQKKMQYKTEKDTTYTYRGKRNIQIQKYFNQQCT